MLSPRWHRAGLADSGRPGNGVLTFITFPHRPTWSDTVSKMFAALDQTVAVTTRHTKIQRPWCCFAASSFCLVLLFAASGPLRHGLFAPPRIVRYQGRTAPESTHTAATACLVSKWAAFWVVAPDNSRTFVQFPTSECKSRSTVCTVYSVYLYVSTYICIIHPHAACCLALCQLYCFMHISL